LSKILLWYEKQTVIRELYREVVKDKVIISEEEIRNAYPLSNQRLMLRQLLYVSEDKAFEAYQRLQKGERFESLAKESAGSDVELSYILTPREFKWGEIDERLESVAYNLEAMEVSSPINIDQIYHLLQLVNRKENLLLTEFSFQERSDYIEKTIRFREEAKLAERYAKTVLSDKHLEVNGQVLLEFTERLRSAKFYNDETGILMTSMQAGSERNIKDLLDKNLVYFTGGFWTLREFLDYIKFIPPGNRPNLSKPAQLKVDIALIVRDEFMAKEGYKRGLETCPTVKKELHQIREELLAIQMRHAITDTVKILENEIKEYVQDCTDMKDEKYKKFALEKKKQETLEQFLSGLRKQYPVTIYDDILLSIKTTDELGTGRSLNLRSVRRF
ncbi:MAG: peptidylprolyl isomerase, partial [Candidatus Marinimicrobia bacterium]|nr:peptidylprolyl isomerase [Candidatus Neomarinimicrobiota bacterium]